MSLTLDHPVIPLPEEEPDGRARVPYGGHGFNVMDALAAERLEPTLISDAEADRLIDRLASMDERQRRIKAQADAMCREIDNERKSLLFKHETDLREWAMSKLKGKARSVKRLVGTCAFRTVPGRVVVTDPDAALAFCRQWLPEAIRETVDVKALSPLPEIDPETGEITQTVPTGCEWIPSRETFTVRGTKTEGQEDE